MSAVELAEKPKTITIDKTYLKSQASQAVQIFFTPVRLIARTPAFTYHKLILPALRLPKTLTFATGKKMFGGLVEKQLQQHRIAAIVAEKSPVKMGKDAVEDMPNDEWFVDKAIREYERNPRFKHGADGVMRPVKFGLALTGIVGLFATMTLIGGPVGIAAAIGAFASAVGAFTIAPALIMEFNSANEHFKEKVLPPFLVKTSLSVVKYSSKEKAGDLADGAKETASNVKNKVSGFLSKKFGKSKKDEAPQVDPKPKDPAPENKAPKPKSPQAPK